ASGASLVCARGFHAGEWRSPRTRGRGLDRMECPACHSPNIDGARFCAKCGALLPAAAEIADPLIGSIVGGRYRITHMIGEGGMGRVYVGEQQMGTSVRK